MYYADAMESTNKRRAQRVPAVITSFLRKALPDGGYALMQFMSKDLSEGGIFVVTDDLSLFDLSEEVAIIVEKGRSRYYEGSARVVRSARFFGGEGTLTESGFGLMFIEQDDEFKNAVAEEIASLETPSD